jgi:hypothetical protein
MSQMSAPVPVAWQAGFLGILPRLQQCFQIRFRHLPAAEREEAQAEAVAAAYAGYHRLAALDRLADAHPSTVADYACRHVAQGRRLGTAQSRNDVMSGPARSRPCLQRLTPAAGAGAGLGELLLEDRRTGPAELAAFRLDLRDWLSRVSKRNRRIVEQLAAGERPGAVARRYGLSPGRISQLRLALKRSWAQFQGDPAQTAAA